MVLSDKVLWQKIGRSHVLAKNLLVVISNRVRSVQRIYCRTARRNQSGRTQCGNGCVNRTR